MSLRVTRQSVLAIGPGAGAARVTRQSVLVLGPAVLNYEVSATDTLALTHAATVIHSKVIVDTLSLTHEAIIAGHYLRPSSHTIGLTHGATEISVRERQVIHTLSLDENAVVAYIKYVMGIDFLEVEDVAVAVVIKPVQHTLLLSHLATMDLIRRSDDTLGSTQEALVTVVYVRNASDILSIGQQVTYLIEAVRGAEHTLLLEQSVVGDHCRVVATTIGLSDVADAELIRLAHNDLTVSHLAASNWVFIRRRTDNLSLTNVAAKVLERPRGAISILALTQLATAVTSKSIVDTLTLTQAASADNVCLASSILALTHTATVINTRSSAEDDLLDLSDEAAVGFIKQVSACQYLNLNVFWKQNAESGRKVGVATNTLYLRQLASCNLKVRTASDILQEMRYTYNPITWEEITYYVGLQDVATAAVIRNTPYPVSHIISFAEHAVGIVVHADAIAVGAADALSLTHATYANQTPIAIHTLAMTDLAVVVLAKAVSDALVLTDAATVNVLRATMAIVDTLVMGQSVALIVASNLYQYNPIVGEGAPGNPTPPPVTLLNPLSGIEVPFQLIYPAEGTVLDSVTLRAPELGNKDRLSFNRVIRETRGGTLVVFADPMWPKIQTLALTFSGLKRDVVQDLLSFFDDHLGLEIGMIDWEQRYWVGIITTPEEPVIEDDSNSYSVKFEFEGELDPTWTP